MDIALWLRSLGLGKYEAIFRENDIDEAVLPSLTHENLKELGVASFGGVGGAITEKTTRRKHNGAAFGDV